jgi:hypothetical protein
MKKLIAIIMIAFIGIMFTNTATAQATEVTVTITDSTTWADLKTNATYADQYKGTQEFLTANKGGYESEIKIEVDGGSASGATKVNNVGKHGTQFNVAYTDANGVTKYALLKPGYKVETDATTGKMTITGKRGDSQSRRFDNSSLQRE